jgi:hypothetical protein
MCFLALGRLLFDLSFASPFFLMCLLWLYSSCPLLLCFFLIFFCVLLGSVPSTFVAALMSSSLIHVGYSVYIFLIVSVSVFCNDK